MIISIASDHAGFLLKQALIRSLKDLTFLDRGTHSTESVDYPDFAALVAQDIIHQKANFGVLICDTGIGISISANKVDGIRAALAYNEDAAGLSRHHNNANILCLAAKYTPPPLAQKILHIFINSPFDGGRHERRINKISLQEKNL